MNDLVKSIPCKNAGGMTPALSELWCSTTSAGARELRKKGGRGVVREKMSEVRELASSLYYYILAHLPCSIGYRYNNARANGLLATVLAGSARSNVPFCTGVTW